MQRALFWSLQPAILTGSGCEIHNHLQRVDVQVLVCRLMMEFQGDIESRSGSVALNSSAVSGDVSGKLHSRLPRLVPT